MARRPVLYPRIYPWYVIVATLDVLLTWAILTWITDSAELNPIAASLINHWGMSGATFFKFATVMFVMWSCEFIGQRKMHVGRRLAAAAVLLNCVPLTASAAQLAVFGH
jgi:hypothetical protein